MLDMVDGMAAFLTHKPMSKEISKRLKKNGSLADYQREMKENPPQRLSEETLGNFYNAFK